MTTGVWFMEEFERLFKAEKKRISQEWSRYPATGKKPEVFSLEFGINSRALNQNLRELCREPEDLKAEPLPEKNERMRLRWAYAYWWNRVHLMERLAKTRLGEVKTRKGIEKGGTTLRKLILGEISLDKIHPQFLGLIDSLNHMKIEPAAMIKQSETLLNQSTEEKGSEDGATV